MFRNFIRKWLNLDATHECQCVVAYSTLKVNENFAPRSTKPHNMVSQELPLEEVVKVKFLHPEAKLPKMGREGDAAFDLSSCEEITIMPYQVREINCGVACEIPPDYKMMINGRSGLASKGIFAHFGTSDPNYRGRIGTILINLSKEPYLVRKGDRVGQISLQKIVPTRFIEVDELSESNRGVEGFGSSGR